MAARNGAVTVRERSTVIVKMLQKFQIVAAILLAYPFGRNSMMAPMKSRIIPRAVCAASIGVQTARKPIVEFEMMTWPEVKKAIHKEGK